MNSSVFLLFKFFFVLGLPSGALVFNLYQDRTPILFQSAEALLQRGESVLNEVAFYPGEKEDIWMMNQSHKAFDKPKHNWDRLAIVVNKEKGEAKFYQLEPGPLAWPNQLKPVDFTVSCYMCHSNGPRALRPLADSGLVELSIWDQARIQAWNLRIKTYGNIISEAGHESKTPFQLAGEFENEELDVKTCNECHSADSLVGREPLKRQHFMAIKYLVDSGDMPPPGYSMSEKEKKQVQDFLKGF